MVRFIGKSVCSKKVVEDFWDGDFSHVVVEGRVVDSNMTGFSSLSVSLFAVFFYYLEVVDVGSGVIVGNTVYVN